MSRFAKRRNKAREEYGRFASETVLMKRQQLRMPAQIRAYVALLFTENSGSIRETAHYYAGDISTPSRQLANPKQRLTSNSELQEETNQLKEYVNAIALA